MFKKALKTGLIAFLATIAIAAPTFADAKCDNGELKGSGPLESYAGLSTKKEGEYKITCSGKVNGITLYGKTTADCTYAGQLSANPEGICNKQADLTTVVSTIINAIVFVVGIIAVVMIVIGGINYAMSQGDPGKVKKAKDTILYGIIGLVVALLAFAIVQFVLNALQG